MPDSVLFVDDEPQVTESILRSLHREPYHLLRATSGAQALNILASTPDISVVVSDERMPGMTGSELVSRIRAQHPTVMCMILTGQADLAAAITAINHGEIYRFLTKPCNAIDLAMAIRLALRQRLLVMKARLLLQGYRTQMATLAELERKHPGISQIDRDSQGRVVIEDDGDDLESLLKNL